MKKIIAILLTMLVLFSFTACGPQEIMTFSDCWGKKDVYEKSTYEVTVEKGEAAFEGAPRLSGKGSYETIITGGEKEGYKLETVFVFEGEYTYADGKKSVSDKIETYVMFNGVIGQNLPISSYRKYDGSTVSYENGKYTVKPLSFESTTSYGEKKITIKTAAKGSDGKYTEQISNLPTSFDISRPKGSFYDNEQIFVIGRSMSKSVNFSQSFSLISSLSQEALAMGMQIAETKKFATNINGESKEMEAYAMKLGKTGTSETGSVIMLYYAVFDKGMTNNSSGGQSELDRSRLLKIEQVVPYSADILVFNLTGYQYGKNA